MHAEGLTHTCSLVVHVNSEFAPSAEGEINRLGIAEVCARDEAGRFVVLLETQDESDLLNTVRSLEHMNGVLGVVMAYHHAEPA